jgi:hypothetical protein
MGKKTIKRTKYIIGTKKHNGDKKNNGGKKRMGHQNIMETKNIISTKNLNISCICTKIKKHNGNKTRRLLQTPGAKELRRNQFSK